MSARVRIGKAARLDTRQAEISPAASRESRPASFTLDLASMAPIAFWRGTEAVGIKAAVTTRIGGVSEGDYESLNLGLNVGDDPGHVVQNRRIAAELFSSSLSQFIYCDQQHGTSALLVDGSWAGRGTTSRTDAPKVDALVTTTSSLVLAVLVADCLPVLLLDPTAQVLGLAHAGWRGTASNVVARTLALMESVGAHPERCLILLGPAISPAAYQVGPEVVDQINKALGQPAASCIFPHKDGGWALDLEAANRTLLTCAGVRQDQIFSSHMSTASPCFFSHRLHHPCGRFAMFAQLCPSGPAACAQRGTGAAH